MKRMEQLIANRYQLVAYKDLTPAYQAAIAYYMALDGAAWAWLGDPNAFVNSKAKKALLAAIPLYVEEYGETQWGVVTVPVEEVKSAILADESLEREFSTWEALEKSWGKPLKYSRDNRWPVFLSSDDYQTLQDGWTRMYAYVCAKHPDIPAVFYPEAHHSQAKSGF